MIAKMQFFGKNMGFLVEFAQHMAQEREKESLWDSRLFKVGAVAAAVGVLIGSATFLGIGVVAMGGVLAMRKGEGK